MSKSATIASIVNPGIIAIIRSDGPEGLVEAAEALYSAGIKAVEISMTTPGTLKAIENIRAQLPQGCVIGVGTALDGETAVRSIAAGAQFVVSPVNHQGIIEACLRYHVPTVMGAFTPSEALYAQQWGADFIKIFPANTLGPGYMKALLAPLPQLALVPTGGVTVDNCVDYLKAGCKAVAIGSKVVNAELIRAGDFGEITRRASRYVDVLAQLKEKK